MKEYSEDLLSGLLNGTLPTAREANLAAPERRDAQRLRELFEAEASADVNIDFEYEER